RGTMGEAASREAARLQTPARLSVVRRCRFRSLPYPAVEHQGAEGVEAKPRLTARMTTYVRKNGSHLATEALVNFILPFAIYNYAQGPLGDVRALLASSVPPILWSLMEFA